MLFSLRPAVPADAAALAPLAARTFLDGWASVITPPVAAAYVAQAFTPSQLAAEIEDPASCLLVAENEQSQLIGYARLAVGVKVAPSFVTGPRPLLLQRLYVASEARGKGVADALLETLGREALRRGGETLWLDADPRNERAWRFYLRRGFVDVGGAVYALPGAVNDRVRVMQKPIAPAVRRGTTDDAEALSVMAAAVFRDTFGPGNDPDTMASYLASAFHPRTLQGELADPENHFLLAVSRGVSEEIVGYTKLSYAPDEHPSCVTGPVPIAELERFYVRHEWHGTGVAGTLMQATLQAAAAGGARTLWLGVFDQNARARRFYARWDFADVGEHLFHFGTEAQTDRVMVRPVS
ncbi:MAG: GNAT family N-acetyltransferase [Cytophagales bacterium]|nr:GNAT family N-acetyltransferase [Armatimonadota bacterium]